VYQIWLKSLQAFQSYAGTHTHTHTHTHISFYIDAVFFDEVTQPARNLLHYTPESIQLSIACH
jgi:hypothetical protein